MLIHQDGSLTITSPVYLRGRNPGPNTSAEALLQASNVYKVCCKRTQAQMINVCCWMLSFDCFPYSGAQAFALMASPLSKLNRRIEVQ